MIPLYAATAPGRASLMVYAAVCFLLFGAAALLRLYLWWAKGKSG